MDHTGLLPAELDVGVVRVDGAVLDARDSGVDVPTLDAPPDVRMSDAGPDIPLPVECEVYVSTGGDDSATGSATTPLQSLKAALEMLPSVICVAGGDYNGEVTIAFSVRLRGSFCPGFTQQSSDDCLSRIRAPRAWAVLVRGEDGRHPTVEIESFHIETANAEPEGGSTYGVRVVDSDLTLTNVTILAKSATDGVDGMPRGTAAQGDRGGNGGLQPGERGNSCRPGGRGGRLLPNATDGDDAEGASGEFGRGGAVGGNGVNGTNGNDAPPTAAASGLGGSGNGFLSPEGFYLPAPGESGATGMAGFGGGGGGAGTNNFGRHGGGGGGGGCGGIGGEGGGGGGGSFGVTAVSSTLFVSGLQVTLGNGGDGGDGGDGGGGGDGGVKGDGADINGAHGGDGGRGGRGGPGGPGGGGVGGPASAIVLANSNLMMGTPEVIGGTGGDGGGGGSMGAAGSVEPVLTVPVR